MKVAVAESKVNKSMDPIVDILIERSRARRLLRAAVKRAAMPGPLAAEIEAFLKETEVPQK